MHPSLVILYVADPVASTAFYRRLLGVAPVEASANFAMFVHGGGRLAVWSRAAVQPAAQLTGGGTELAFLVADVDAVFTQWCQLGLPVLQPPTDMEFGRTFVATDPDGHRLRVYCPAQE